MKAAYTCTILFGIALLCAGPATYSQVRRNASQPPQIDVTDYVLDVALTPDAHEMKVAATIKFVPARDTDYVVFDLSENLSVQKILNSDGVELEFGQDESGPGMLSVRFSRPIPAGVQTAIKVEYSGGFDRDRYSRFYARDEGSAYIGMEESYLFYSSKWFPINRYLVDRATATINVTVPLGLTVVGPGDQLPVVTKAITETFRWTAKSPVLPNSIVAGQYFEKKVQGEGFTLNCYAREGKLESIQKSAETAAKILAFYQKTFGPAAAGDNFRLVEVDDRLARQPGSLGTIFVTHSELAQSTPPVRELARKIAYQWWADTVGVQSVEDLWLEDGLAYYSAAEYLGSTLGDSGFKEEAQNLAILGLKFESKSPVRTGASLGYRSEGYQSVVGGKGAWVMIMLREILGPAKFHQLLQQYAKESVGSGGATSGFQKIAQQLQGKDLGWFFSEWVDTIGVPTFQADYVVLKTATGFRVSGTVVQDRDLFKMPVEVAVISGDRQDVQTVDLNGKSTPFDVNSSILPKQIVLDPNNKILRDSKDLRTAVQLSLGNDLRAKGDFVEAIRAYEGALKLNPHKSMAHYLLAESFYEQFNLQSAANSFRDALNGDKDPKWIEVWCYIYLGKIYDILGQRQRAMAEYNKALNTKDDTNGAQEEAKKWVSAPFTRERTVLGTEAK